MKRIHVISVEKPNLCDVAISIKTKEHIVTCSGVDIEESVKERLLGYDLMPAQEGWHPELLNKNYDFVIVPNDIKEDNPEYVQAKSLGLLVLSFSEYMFVKLNDKSRVLICGNNNRIEVARMISYVLSKNNLLFDYVFSEDVAPGEMSLSWGYDARLAVIEENTFASPFINKRVNEYYRPHILVLADMKWTESEDYPTKKSYIEALKSLILSVERDGKIIYRDVTSESCLDKDDEMVEVLSSIREDITAMPYLAHPMKSGQRGCYLDTRFCEYMIERNDEVFLETLNAARLACRLIGLPEKSFYESISEYSLIKR